MNCFSGIQKFFLSMLLILSSASSAYTHQIINNTPGLIRATANLIAWSPKSVDVPPGEERDLDVVGWLTDSIRVEGISDVVGGLSASIGVPDPKFSKEITVDYSGPINLFWVTPPVKPDTQSVYEYVEMHAPKPWASQLVRMPGSLVLSIQPRPD